MDALGYESAWQEVYRIFLLVFIDNILQCFRKLCCTWFCGHGKRHRVIHKPRALRWVTVSPLSMSFYYYVSHKFHKLLNHRTLFCQGFGHSYILKLVEWSYMMLYCWCFEFPHCVADLCVIISWCKYLDGESCHLSSRTAKRDVSTQSVDFFLKLCIQTSDVTTDVSSKQTSV